MKISLSERDIKAALTKYFSDTFGRAMQIQSFDFTAARQPKRLSIQVDVEPCNLPSEDSSEENEACSSIEPLGYADAATDVESEETQTHSPNPIFD